jgi:AcrR family transcriptional regulator
MLQMTRSHVVKAEDAMSTSVQGPRPIGRPRVFTDQDVFQATSRAIERLGFTDLTLAAVASELGCSPPALIKRFGSKKGLAIAYCEWAHDASLERFDQIRQEATSPLEALRMRFRIPTQERRDEFVDQEGFANWVAFSLAARNDPELTEAILRRRRVFYGETERLVSDAIEAGELIASNAQTLARNLLAALTGTALLWILESDDSPLQERLSQTLEELLAPYLPSSS